MQTLAYFGNDDMLKIRIMKKMSDIFHGFFVYEKQIKYHNKTVKLCKMPKNKMKNSILRKNS